MKRINNEFFKQLEETKLENEKLKSANRLLRGYKAEAISLRAKIDELESTIEDRVSKRVSEAVKKATAPLITKIEEQ